MIADACNHPNQQQQHHSLLCLRQDQYAKPGLARSPILHRKQAVSQRPKEQSLTSLGYREMDATAAHFSASAFVHVRIGHQNRRAPKSGIRAYQKAIIRHEARLATSSMPELFQLILVKLPVMQRYGIQRVLRQFQQIILRCPLIRTCSCARLGIPQDLCSKRPYQQARALVPLSLRQP